MFTKCLNIPGPLAFNKCLNKVGEKYIGVIRIMKISK